MARDVNSPVPEVLSVRRANEKVASAAFRAALRGNPIQDLAKVKEISEYTSPQNWVALARAALVHAGEIPATDFDPLIATTSSEFGSQLYDFSWSLCTYATIPTPRAVEVYTAMLAATALCLCPAENIELRDLRGDHSRGRDFGMADYKGPISMMPGNRMIWDTSKAHLYAERNIAGPLAAWALGQDWEWKHSTPKHKTLGWAMDAAHPQPREGRRHGHKVDLPRDPAELIPLIDKLKTRSNQRLEILLFPGGRKFALLSRSSFSTRGPALVTEYIPGQKLFRLISPSEQRGGGEWSACSARLREDRSWAVWQSGNESKRIEGQVPEPEMHIVWDSDGCRVAGEVQVPDPIPEIEQAGGVFHAALTKLGNQGLPDSEDREARGRTAFEVMLRIAQEKRSKARRGAETLLRDMRDWVSGPDPLPAPIPEIQQAGGLYHTALTKLGNQGYPDSANREARGRTAFAVMERIAADERSLARQGAETLLRDMTNNGW